MSYHVGQIIFVVFNKKVQVYPMMIIEEIVKRTLDGENVNYVLRGGSDSSSTILLSQIDGEVFESADEAKYVLISRATEQIEKMVDSAIEKSKKWYSTASQEKEIEKEIMSLPNDKSNKNISGDEINVTFPDGTIAKLKNSNLIG